MVNHRRLFIHGGQVVWPEHRNLESILELRTNTPADAWKTTYQSMPVAAGGAIFDRTWWIGSRFKHEPFNPSHKCIAKWQSWDTSLTDSAQSAYTSMVMGELGTDYRLYITNVFRKRVLFPELVDLIVEYGKTGDTDNKLRGIIVEDRASGISALQTIRASTEQHISSLLCPYRPTKDKENRARQASVWCANGSVLLPHPSVEAPWLYDFETELFSFPGSTYADQVDAFSQLVIYIEHILSEGYAARGGIIE